MWFAIVTLIICSILLYSIQSGIPPTSKAPPTIAAECNYAEGMWNITITAISYNITSSFIRYILKNDTQILLSNSLASIQNGSGPIRWCDYAPYNKLNKGDYFAIANTTVQSGYRFEIYDDTFHCVLYSVILP